MLAREWLRAFASIRTEHVIVDSGAVMDQKKNIEIEYLRAVAVCMTLAAHLSVLLPFYKPSLTSIIFIFNPATGVDLFFCISGYVVSCAYLDYFDRYRQSGNFGIAVQSFWLRRLYRLLPTSWLWILIPLLLSISFNTTGSFGSWYDNLRSFTAVATFSGNFANLDYFGSSLGPNGAYWSLALEEQFYFLLPLFLLLVTSKRWRVGGLLALIALQFGLDRNPFNTPLSALFSAFRMDSMMWGVLLCLFTRSAQYRQYQPICLQGSGPAKIVLTVALLYFLGAIAGQLMKLPTATGLVAIVSLLLVWLSSYQEGYIYCPRGLSGVLSWLGSRSYAIYVIHFCAYHFAIELWTRYSRAQGEVLGREYALPLVLTALVLIVLAAEFNFRLVEEPLRRKGAEISRRRLQRFTEGGEAASVAPPTRVEETAELTK